MLHNASLYVTESRYEEPQISGTRYVSLVLDVHRITDRLTTEPSDKGQLVNDPMPCRARTAVSPAFGSGYEVCLARDLRRLSIHVLLHIQSLVLDNSEYDQSR